MLVTATWSAPVYPSRPRLPIMRKSTNETRAALYLRLSYEQRSGQAEATHERQERDCRALAKRQGLEVVAVFRDTDSAYSGKARPGYRAMTEAAERGEFDVLIVWRTDRLYRRLRDLLEITDGLAKRVRIESVMGGEIDLTTADGRMHAQMLGSVAEHESAVKSERVAARIRQRAVDERRPAAGGRRQYGWWPVDEDPDRPGHPRPGGRAGWTVYEAEAAYLREAYARAARGDSIASIARWLNDQDQVGPSGQPFKVATVRSLMKSARQAGLVTYRNQIVGDAADGQRVVDVATWQQVQVRLNDPTKDRTVREKTLLAGIARCTRCGEKFSSSTKDDGSRRVPILRCRGCGASRRRGLVEPLVVAAVGKYLVKHRRRLLVPAKPRKDGGDVAESLRQVDEDLAGLDALLASGQMRVDGYARAQGSLLARREELLGQLSVRTGRPATAALAAVEDPAAAWERLVEEDLVAARAVLREIVEAIEISPSAVASRPDPNDVRIRWAS